MGGQPATAPARRRHLARIARQAMEAASRIPRIARGDKPASRRTVLWRPTSAALEAIRFARSSASYPRCRSKGAAGTQGLFRACSSTTKAGGNRTVPCGPDRRLIEAK